ncbi:MAG: hypothetical protein CMJ65_06525 [Planctomycetaceae bacterium]|jgi:GNAT superfamily N-acetyltransferase|nr:hypothetical protein [Planctomycetaceae bacterium]MDP7274433.1 GNAT family N-acetyltransferase [Planctomycetaceae bacterium]
MHDEPMIEAQRAPLPAELTSELAGFWEKIFETSFDESREVLGNGIDVGRNRDTVWFVRSRRIGDTGDDKQGLAATSHLTVPNDLPSLGGLGGVATDPGSRRQGLGERLCREARDEFRDGGGDALFLGTVNPSAARVYFRLGWRRLAGSTVMANITADVSPEEFLVDWFRGAAGPVTVRPGSAHARIAMIPLLLLPHDEQVLDANVDLFSTRYMTQNSCMGLYPRYAELASGGGAWFGGWSAEGRLIGLATARPLTRANEEAGRMMQVDGCVHRVARAAWRELIDAAIGWSRDAGAGAVTVLTSVEDEAKRIQFEAIGFRSDGSGDEIDIAGRRVQTVRLKLRL